MPSSLLILSSRQESDHATELSVGSNVSSSLINRIDAMLHKLEKEIDDVDAKFGDRWRILDRDYDGKVTPDEVTAAALYLKDTLGQEALQNLIIIHEDTLEDAILLHTE